MLSPRRRVRLLCNQFCYFGYLGLMVRGGDTGHPLSATNFPQHQTHVWLGTPWSLVCGNHLPYDSSAVEGSRGDSSVHLLRIDRTCSLPCVATRVII
jgi:hypothetical protein